MSVYACGANAHGALGLDENDKNDKSIRALSREEIEEKSSFVPRYFFCWFNSFYRNLFFFFFFFFNFFIDLAFFRRVDALLGVKIKSVSAGEDFSVCLSANGDVYTMVSSVLENQIYF